jgi:hypothetical protein
VDYISAVDQHMKESGLGKAATFKALNINPANYYNQKSRERKAALIGRSKAKKSFRPTSGFTQVEAAPVFSERVVVIVCNAKTVRENLAGWLS